MFQLVFLFFATAYSAGTDGIIKFLEYSKGGGQYLHINWSSIPNAADLNWYQVNRSINDQEFQTISTMDLEAGDHVSVLNVYPTGGVGCTTYCVGSATMRDEEGTLIDGVNHMSAGLKVYMEGGTITSGGKTTKVEGTGKLNVNGEVRQLIYVTPISFEEYHKDSSIINKYDVTMFGSWDNFAAGSGANPSDEEVDELMKYLEDGNGLLIGHDGISAILGKESGFGKLANLLDIKIGNLQNNVVPRDTEINFQLYSRYVKVSRDGRLTTYPWSLGNLGTVMNIPESHTACQFALGDVWFEFTGNSEGKLDYSTCRKDNICRTTTGTSVEEAFQIGNPIFYLTTKGNLAFIQTGHSKGESKEDERKILANTLFYLKQKSKHTYVNDFDIYDTEPPSKPALVSVKHTQENKTYIKVKATDKGTKYVYYIVASNPIFNSERRSENVTAIITSGMKGFKYLFDKNPTVSDIKLLTEEINVTENEATSKKSSRLSLKAETSLSEESEAMIEVDFHSEETYYLHVISVDNKDTTSVEITNIEIKFPLVPPVESADSNNNNGNENDDDKKLGPGQIAGIVVGVVAGAAAAAAAIAAAVLCHPPIIIAPIGGAAEEEEEEEEEDVKDDPKDDHVIAADDEQMDPNDQKDEADNAYGLDQVNQDGISNLGNEAL